MYKINSLGSVEFYYGAEPIRPMLRKSGSTLYDPLGRVIKDIVDINIPKNTEADRVDLSKIEPNLREITKIHPLAKPELLRDEMFGIKGEQGKVIETIHNNELLDIEKIRENTQELIKRYKLKD